MIEVLRAKYYASNQEVKTPVRKWFKEKSTDIYKAKMHVLIRRWNNAIKRNSHYVEK